MRHFYIFKIEGVWCVRPDTYLIPEYFLKCASFEEARQFVWRQLHGSKS